MLAYLGTIAGMLLVHDEALDVASIRRTLVLAALETGQGFTFHTDGGHLTGEHFVFGAMIQDRSYHGRIESLPDGIVGGFLGLEHIGADGWSIYPRAGAKELLESALQDPKFGLFEFEARSRTSPVTC